MARQRHPSIAREGWLPIALLVLVAGTLWLLQHDTWPIAAVLAGATALKFRDPEREIPAEPLGVVSPVDGRVVAVDDDRIVIRIAFFGAYSGRAPVEGKVLDAPGTRGMRIQTDEGDEVLLDVNSAPSFGRPRAIVGYGARVGQGQRCAWLRLARVAVVTVPPSARPCVEPGRHVLAGADILAVLVHEG